MLLTAGCSVTATAQNKNIDHGTGIASPRWCLDLSLLGGMANQSFKTANSLANYPNAINSNLGDLKYSNGYSYGADLQLGFFMGARRHFGLGTGVMIMEQRGDATLTNYHMDYRTTDAAGNIYRQVITGNNVKENIVSSMVNIPLVLKYKNRFSKHWGFTADAGALINVQMNNTYSTEASFDQGAIYKFAPTGDGGNSSVYDYSATPSTSDWLITKANFLRNNPNGNWQEYARIKRALGINVGDRLPSNNLTGNTRYNTASVGFIVQPSVNYYLSDNVALNLGGYFMMQPFKNNALSNYRLTDGNGSYSSVLNNVTASTNTAYGVNAGVRFFLGRTKRDRDKDGVADNKDKCPDVFGLAEFDGCPDTDKDGIPDAKDSCVTIWGLVQFAGCPDSDNDSIPDKTDDCPYAAGPRKLNGCPDRDLDGIADKNDHCPDTFGLAVFHGCPDTDGDGIPNNEDDCPLKPGAFTNHGCPAPDKTDTKTKGDMTMPILFEVNLSTIQPASQPIIDDAIDELNKDRKATILIDGHADASGPDQANKVLSLKRANAVKSELTRRGVDPARLKTVGHGSSVPAATNSTYEGKQQNRRAKMKLQKTK